VVSDEDEQTPSPILSIPPIETLVHPPDHIIHLPLLWSHQWTARSSEVPDVVESEVVENEDVPI
jgi:hypothetical protein